MKVLTIKQPFATLIAEGLKEYEFRTWKTSYRGEFLIHAGKGIDKEAMKRYEHLNLTYPTGQIIAKVTLTDCVYIDEEMKKRLKEKDPLVYYGMINSTSDKPHYGFKIENVEKIKPIDINGQLSFWEYPKKIK
ncbi:MAG: ASCH domain-containing protein [Bacilli bacterium]|nr:ASCH domain-containing protein [Bacilli bacterium]